MKKGNVSSLNFASVIATFTPKDPKKAPIVYKADVFYTEEQMLSEPTPNAPRSKYFAANDGETGQWIDRFAIDGQRDLILMDGIETEKLIAFAMSNPQPLFDFSFFYKRNDQSAEEARTQLHKGCKFLNHPARIPSNDVVTIRFSLGYAKIQTLDANGQPIGS